MLSSWRLQLPRKRLWRLPCKVVMNVNKRVLGRTLLEATAEQIEERELYLIQLNDVISRVKVWFRERSATAAEVAALVGALSKYPEISSHASMSDDDAPAHPLALCDDDGGGAPLGGEI